MKDKYLFYKKKLFESIINKLEGKINQAELCQNNIKISMGVESV